MAKSQHLSRNEFVRVTVGALGAAIAGIVGIPSIAYILSPALKSQALDAWVQVGPLETFTAGTHTLFTFTRTKINGWEKTANSYGAYIYRKDDGSVIVFSNVCTHLSCRVTWKEDLQEYACPCHAGLFDIDGNVVPGTVPPRPLDRYETKIENDILFLRLLEG